MFPCITKAAATIGATLGKGIVYQDHEIVGMVHLRQANVGFQFGGQQYMEIIFLEDEEAFTKFTNGKLKVDAQASAVWLRKALLSTWHIRWYGHFYSNQGWLNV